MTAPPREVELAYRLGLLGVALRLVGVVVTFVLTDPFAAARRLPTYRPAPRTGAPVVDPLSSPAFRVTITVAVVVGALAYAVFQVFVLRRVRAGASWTRVLLAVLLGFGAVGVLGSLGMALAAPGVLGSGLAPVVGVASVLVDAAVVWLLFRPAARPWFAPAPPPPVPPTSPWRPQPQPGGPGGTTVARAWAPPVSAGALSLDRGRYASWPRRVAGGLVDHGVPTLVFLVVYIPFGFGEPRVLRGGSGVAIMLTVIALCLAWQVADNVVLQGRTGQSLGKRLVGTALVDDRTGRPLGVGRALGRLVAHLLDSLACYLGWLLPLVEGRRRTVGDLLAGSVVLPVADEAVALPG